MSTPPMRPRIPPRPGPGHPGLRRAIEPPPSIGPDRLTDAAYVLDTGVGLAFAHAGKLELLVEHYGATLHVVEDVWLEWTVQANRTIAPLQAGHSTADKAQRDRLVRIRSAAAAILTATSNGQLPQPTPLSYADLPAVQTLIDDIKNLNPPKPADGNDRGECASIHLGTKLRTGDGVDVVLLCSDDDRARRLAERHRVNSRNHHTVLREMVRESRLDAHDAFALYTTMCEVSDLAEHARPTSADDFT